MNFPFSFFLIHPSSSGRPNADRLHAQWDPLVRQQNLSDYKDWWWYVNRFREEREDGEIGR
jgi:hypothetical protein